MDPGTYADEHISTEGALAGLALAASHYATGSTSDATTQKRAGRKVIHYVNITPDPARKAVIRIPWNSLIQFSPKLGNVCLQISARKAMYKSKTHDPLVKEGLQMAYRFAGVEISNVTIENYQRNCRPLGHGSKCSCHRQDLSTRVACTYLCNLKTTKKRTPTLANPGQPTATRLPGHAA